METIPETYIVNNSGFDFTEVATGGANNRGTIMRIDEVEPHGANHFTSLYAHGPDFADYVNDPNTGNGRGSCKGYAGTVKPGFVPFDVDRTIQKKR
jgi:hypothetical protein